MEAVERAERRIARLPTESKLPHDKTMTTLDVGRFPAAVRTQVARLAEGQFLEGKAKCQVTTASVWLLMLDKEE